MKSIKEIETILLNGHMIKLSIGNVPSFVDKNRQEGIEISLGKLKPFWIKDGIRIYNEPVSEHIQKLINVCESEIEKPLVDKIDLPELTNESILPDYITSALVSKWVKMTTTDRVLMFQKTPKEKIYKVIVGKNAQGIEQYASYVEGNYMIKEANASFLFDWYISDMVISACPTGVSVSGRLNAYFTEHHKYLSRNATGYQEINKKTDIEMAKKGATTDMIKKALSYFGFNSDVYGGDI